MHDFQHIQPHVGVPQSAGANRVGSNVLDSSHSMAGIGWTCAKTRKSSGITSEGDSNTERKVKSG